MPNYMDLNKPAIEFNAFLNPMLQELCKPLENYLGVKNFIYTKFLPDGRRICLCNQHYWIENSIEDVVHDSFEHVNGLVQKTSPKKFTYFVRGGFPDNAVLNALYQNNLWNGLSLCIKHSDSMELFSFLGGRQSSEETLNAYINNLALLEKFAYYFKQRIGVNLDDMNKVSLVHPRKSFSFDFSHTDNDQTKELETLFSAMGSVFTYDGRQIKVSARELECLQLIAKGKPAKVIASEMSITPRTVDKYTENLRIKFDVISKFQLADIVNDQKLLL